MTNREKVYKEIKEILGVVPGFFKTIPDASVEAEWEAFKAVQLAETAIPAKYKELIGLGIAAVTHCQYCTHFHTEVARLNGATAAEIEDAVHCAKSSAGWSSYLNGMQSDMDEFKRDVKAICEHVRSTR